MEQRLVAQDRPLDDDRGDRGHDGRAQQGGIHVADDLFEREQHRRHRRVEGGGQRAGRADGHEIPDALAARGRSHRPMTEARPAPICTDGPSRPIEWPEPMHSTPVMNLPKWHAGRE